MILVRESALRRLFQGYRKYAEGAWVEATVCDIWSIGDGVKIVEDPLVSFERGRLLPGEMFDLSAPPPPPGPGVADLVAARSLVDDAIRLGTPGSAHRKGLIPGTSPTPENFRDLAPDQIARSQRIHAAWQVVSAAVQPLIDAAPPARTAAVGLLGLGAAKAEADDRDDLCDREQCEGCGATFDIDDVTSTEDGWFCLPCLTPGPAEVQDMLGLASTYVPIATVKTWTDEQRRAAGGYAAAAVAEAGDHEDVEVPPRPSFLPPASNDIPDWWFAETSEPLVERP